MDATGPDPVVVLAATPRPWGARLRAHAADHGGVTVRATVLTPQDALSEGCDVLLVDDVTSFLTAAFVRDLQAVGRSVLGIHEPDDQVGRDLLAAAGVDGVMPADAAAEELVAHVRRLAARAPEDRPTPRVQPAAVIGGDVVGVVGGSGGVGATEIAVELAASAAAGGTRTVLVDLDESAPALAPRLGLGLSPNVRHGVAAALAARPVVNLLHPLGTAAPLAVLPGLTPAADWARVPQGGVDELLGQLVATNQRVVLDLGRAAAPVETFDGLRLGHARELVGRCDHLVVVAATGPVALIRTIELIAELTERPRRMTVVVNRVGRDRHVRDEAVAELRSATDLEVRPVEEDPAVPVAGWRATRVGRGRFRQQLQGVAPVAAASVAMRGADQTASAIAGLER